MASTKHLQNVAVVGPTGRVGGAFVEALVKNGKHNVTAITRGDSKGKIPAGVKIARVNYDDEQSLVSALEGQDLLAITLSVRAPEDLHGRIVAAAAKAKVPYIMPNTYGFYDTDPVLLKETLYSAKVLEACQSIKQAGASYISMACGYWYEWSLALGEQWFGIDIKKRTVTFFDTGKSMINTSTWDQCGRAFASLLNLPESGSSPSVSDWKNKPLYVSSFRINQRDMLDSLHRVLGTTDDDWKITYESSAKRYQDGLQEMKSGIRTGYAKAMYSRTFYPHGDGEFPRCDGEFESEHGTANQVLGLPQESLDEATKRAVEMVESGWSPW